MFIMCVMVMCVLFKCAGWVMAVVYLLFACVPVLCVGWTRRGCVLVVCAVCLVGRVVFVLVVRAKFLF